MANHKSAKKRARQDIKKRDNNKWKVSRMRTALKKTREAIDNKDKKLATELFTGVQSLLAKLAKSPVLRKRNASRKTSRLASQIARL